MTAIDSHDVAEVHACVEYALWRQDVGPVGAFLCWLGGMAPEKPESYERWKQYCWPGMWP